MQERASAARPRPALRVAAVTASVLLAITVLAACSAAPSESPDRRLSAPEIEAELLRRIQALRLERNLPPLERTAELDTEARAHSRAMAADRRSFGHGGFRQRARRLRTELDLGRVAENVALSAGHPDPVEIALSGWLDSRDHRDNVLGRWDLTGIGVARSPAGPEGTVYFTQLFAVRGD